MGAPLAVHVLAERVDNARAILARGHLGEPLFSA
jgi:hypothetical protein